MKKLFIITAIVFLLCVSLIYAVPPVMITNSDGSKILSNNAVATIANATGMKQQTGNGSIYIGECRLISVVMYSATAADAIGVYDYGNATHRSGSNIGAADIKDLEFELAISANTTSNHYYVGGAPFKFGIYIVAKNSATITGVVFDY